jgi:hypothetical protein
MKLYHGTSERYVERIMRRGLEPRGRHIGNWKHTMLSRPDAVYMSNAYALYFACHTASRTKKEKAAVIEIDTTGLNPFCLHPDEDFLEQATRKKGDAPLDAAMKPRTEWYRERLEDYQEHWELSVEHLGNCCHIGVIPTHALTRVAVIDRDKQWPLCWQAMDPVISLLNFRFCKAKYRGMHKWLFEEPLGEDTVTELGGIQNWNVPETRDGVEVKSTSMYARSPSQLLAGSRRG